VADADGRTTPLSDFDCLFYDQLGEIEEHIAGVVGVDGLAELGIRKVLVDVTLE
jgi:hypothetical protein